MQGLPTNLLTKTAPVAAGKVESNSAVNVNGKVGAITGKESKESTPETKGGFAEIFSGLLGNTETKVEGKAEGKSEGEEGKTPASAEVKLDALLKTKEQEKNQKTEVTALTTDKAMSAEVLKNINNLIDRAPIDDTRTEGQLGQKITSASTNLDQLLKTLKGDNAEVQVEGEEISPEALKQNQKAKSGSPLDFLLKESKSSDVGAVDSKESKLLQTNPETVSKLGLSSEDFLSHKADAKDAKDLKLASSDKTMNLDGEFDLKAFGQKQMNQSMKAYGQKQNLLNDGVIRNTKDLAFGEKKLKAGESELTTPDMKIGADLSHMKDQFIPLVQKQEMAAQNTTQGSEKVLDLSKINSTNTTEIIKKISDYIEQSQVANSNTMDLTVKHEALGQFKIQVNRPIGPGNQMDMQITTTTAEGHDFFMKNEIGLMKNLSQAGIQLSDLRIVSGGENTSFAGNDSKQNNNNSQSNSQAGREFMSFDSAGDSSHGADRRKELWQEARNNQMRYGA